MRSFVTNMVFALFFAAILPSVSMAGERELVVFGTKSCVYCQVMKREVVPNYRWSKAGRVAPMKEVDIDRHGTRGYSLRSGITVTPTIVMFKRGREVARINGYPGKKNFYRMVDQMLKRTR